MVYAGFLRRLVAVLIDLIILYAVFFVIGLVLGINLVAVEPGQMGAASVLQFVSLVVWWLYFALQESSSKQATIGKRAIGIKVADMSGKRISFGKATGRHFGKIISSIILMIGFIMAAFTAKKQALHDMMAGTLVVMK